MVSAASSHGTVANFQQEIDISAYFELVKQKVTTITIFSNLQFLPCTTSYGYLVVIDTYLMHPIYCQKVHKGNITASCFVDANKYFVTASGSFSQNHDNTINVYLVCTIGNEVFFKKIHGFKNAHGKFKGVMNVVSSNNDDDVLVITCGNIDDGYIKVWNVVERQVIFQINDPNSDSPVPYYTLNVIALDNKMSVQERKKLERSPGPEELYNHMDMHLLVVATSINDVTMFEIKYREESVPIIGPIECDAEIGSYLSISMILKSNERQFKLLVANIEGTIETFDLILDVPESVRSTQKIKKNSLGMEQNFQNLQLNKAMNLSRSSGSEEIDKHNPMRSPSNRKRSLLDFTNKDKPVKDDFGHRLVKGLIELTKSKRRNTADASNSGIKKDTTLKEIKLFPEQTTVTQEKSKTTSQA